MPVGQPSQTEQARAGYSVQAENWAQQTNSHMYKFKVGESEMCPCNADIMTAEHLLQHCQLHVALRLVIGV